MASLHSTVTVNGPASEKTVPSCQITRIVMVCEPLVTARKGRVQRKPVKLYVGSRKDLSTSGRSTPYCAATGKPSNAISTPLARQPHSHEPRALFKLEADMAGVGLI
jgi:hypothetical protein